MSTPPLAEPAPEPRRGWTRLLPLLAVVFALVLLRREWSARGPRLVVRAPEGHGLEAGDEVRHLGIAIGTVEAVELAADGSGVELGVRLARSAAPLARRGTRFWIARPELGVEGVRGLETALGARYLALAPGPLDAPGEREFVALSEPPLAVAEDPAALEVVLRAERRGGLARGAPVLYRGIPIGALVSVALASDAGAVEARARIHAEHAELVRVDSRFARARGFELSLGLGGLDLAVASLQSLWLGGVELATPTHPGARAATGERFELADEPADEWRTWRPALALGRDLPDAAQVPARTWARLEIEPRGWFRRARARAGWVVHANGELVGPADLLVAPPEAERAVLELGGERLTLDSAPSWSAGGLARRTFPGGGPQPAPARTSPAPEELLLFGDPLLAPLALAPTALVADPSGWRVEGAPLDERWHGALALARADGRWVGVLLRTEDDARVVPLLR